MQNSPLSKASLFVALITLSFASFCIPCVAGPHKILIPVISFPETEFNLGNVKEGVECKHIFKIENHGQKTLVVKTAYSTCGCTIPHIKKKNIAPGESGDLEVIMNTSMKQGDVTKPIEIRTNDPVNPVSTIYIKAKVESPHANLDSDRSIKIFSGRCMFCHVTGGIGKVGEELFWADCAMCHGFRGSGIKGVAPALIPFDYHDKDIASAKRDVIANGSKFHRSMPGFSKVHGGPLNDKEIDSLVHFLQVKSDEAFKSEQQEQKSKKL